MYSFGFRNDNLLIFMALYFEVFLEMLARVTVKTNFQKHFSIGT
jgi:hypothetical protein